MCTEAAACRFLFIALSLPLLLSQQQRQRQRKQKNNASNSNCRHRAKAASLRRLPAMNCKRKQSPRLRRQMIRKTHIAIERMNESTNERRPRVQRSRQTDKFGEREIDRTTDCLTSDYIGIYWYHYILTQLHRYIAWVLYNNTISKFFVINRYILIGFRFHLHL